MNPFARRFQDCDFKSYLSISSGLIEDFNTTLRGSRISNMFSEIFKGFLSWNKGLFEQ